MSFPHTPVTISVFFDWKTGPENPQHYKVSGGLCETVSERDALLASYPKALGLKPVAVHYSGGVVKYGVQGHGNFLATKGNAKNETGIKRAIRLLDKLEYAGDKCSNVYPTADEARAAL